MAVTLRKATREDLETLWKMQTEAFSELLDKYQDYDMSPAAESLEKITAKFEQPWTTYYFIVEQDEKSISRILGWLNGDNACNEQSFVGMLYHFNRA